MYAPEPFGHHSIESKRDPKTDERIDRLQAVRELAFNSLMRPGPQLQ